MISLCISGSIFLVGFSLLFPLVAVLRPVILGIPVMTPLGFEGCTPDE
jgi:hypothetical protein